MHRYLAANAIVLVLATSCIGGSPVAAAQIVPDTAQRADGTRLDTTSAAMCGRRSLGKVLWTFRFRLVGAAMCSTCWCGSRDRWP